ncbi:hypothetical protein B0H10DRAFT_370649 [Mycena sp. CBHHK59/15]|nr:hypothetical protein B0H10DRAFT_370649 [Mycena sp. CBHHK59/15]
MADPLHTLATLLMQSSPPSVEIVPGGVEQWFGETVAGATQPSTSFPFLYMDGHLGVPQKVLYQLYVSGLELLNLKDKQKVTTMASIPSQMDASCVILLANPAHQTVLNVRKRLIQTGALSAKTELGFSATLLSSSRQCAKESILWAHRRWIFGRLYPHTLSQADSRPLPPTASSEMLEIPPDAIAAEFELISKCCEAYPRNYHAWAHHHFVTDSIFASLRASNTPDSHYLRLLAGEIGNLQRWVETHVSDHSAVHQFCSIVSRLQLLVSPRYDPTLAKLVDPAVLFEHAISLTTSYPSHESLWMYIRAMIILSPVGVSTLASSAISLTSELDSPLRDRFILWTKRSGTTTLT